MKYKITQISDDTKVRRLLSLLSDDLPRERFIRDYQQFRGDYPATDHHDPIWMIYVYLSEYADGTIDRATAIERVIEHAQETQMLPIAVNE